MRKVLWSMVVFFFLFTHAMAQQTPCGQFGFWEKVNQADPEFKRKQAELEKFTQQYTQQYFNRLSAKWAVTDTALYVIPVVFHVMHDCGPENISKSQIEDATRIMNLDFQARHPDTSAVIPLFKPIVGNCRVEFRLATKDPNGNCTEGITRHQTQLTYGGDDALKAVVQWPPNRYLNIWVSNYITYFSAAAYATLPGSAAGNDGIVICYNYVGSIEMGLPQGRHILSHETGHFLNLQHTWGNSSGPGLSGNCNIDDGVADTPNTIGSNFACDVAQAICQAGVVENVQNIMDYSSCDIMFTQGQVARMQAALNSTISNRNNLWSLANLAKTGTTTGYLSPSCKPIAMLCDKPIMMCTGQSFTVKNQTYGGDSSQFQWSFPGSTQLTSTVRNPTIQYLNPGTYDLKLTAFNSAGSSVFERTGFVEVIASIGSPLPVNQGFEENDFPYPSWKTESETGYNWLQTSQAAQSGNSSLYHPAEGAIMDKKATLYTCAYNFTDASAPFFNFKMAFARPAQSVDALKVYMSVDCGNSWTLRYSKTGSSLVTSADTSLQFIPSPADWRQEAFNIVPAIGKPNVRFRFEFTYKGGGNIYLDALNIGGLVAAKSDLKQSFETRIIPNPAQSEAVLEIDAPSSTKIDAALFGVDGRLVETLHHQCVIAEKHSVTIRRPKSPGLYFLQLQVNGAPSVHKICFEY